MKMLMTYKESGSSWFHKIASYLVFLKLDFPLSVILTYLASTVDSLSEFSFEFLIKILWL